MANNVFQNSADMPTVPHRGVLRPKDFADDFTFTHYPPPAELAQHVAYIWVISWNFPSGVSKTSPTVLPNPQFNMFFSDEGVGIQDIFKARRIYTAEGAGKVVGVTFKPGGLYAYWPHDMSLITNANNVLTDLFPQVGSEYASSLLAKDPEHIYEQLIALLATRTPIHDENIALVQRIIDAIEQESTLVSVKDVAQSFGKSQRSLQALFQHYVGVGVKWILLRKRLLKAIEQIRSQATPNWSAVAFALGYSSQAHFITDFKQTIGMTPMQYLHFAMKA